MALLRRRRGDAGGPGSPDPPHATDEDGKFRFAFCEYGNGTGKLNNPILVAFDGAGNELVSDLGNNRVQVFDMQGGYRYQLGASGTGDGELQVPNGIAVYRGNTIFVVSYLNKNFVKLKVTGLTPE
jgi:hypothetical protein